MHKNPNMILSIEGHASSDGSSLYNLNLSAQRSKSVQQFFIDRGITKERLNIDFYGEDAPLNSNSTEEERAENRRVHFAIKYHLIDKIRANEIQSEYDSLLGLMYGNISENVLQNIASIPDSNEESEISIVSEVNLEFDADTVIVDVEQQNEIEEKPKYSVIVQVFSNVENAINYTDNNKEFLEYTSINEKYYVFAFSSHNRKEAEEYRDNYSSESWILGPR